MRALRLVGLAAEVEWFRVRREALLLTHRALWRSGAAVFAAAALVMLHIAAWYVLAPHLGLGFTALVIAMADALICAALLLIARPGHDRVAEEAARTRTALLHEAREENPITDMARALTGRSATGAVAGLLADAAVTAVSRRRRKRPGAPG